MQLAYDWHSTFRMLHRRRHHHNHDPKNLDVLAPPDSTTIYLGTKGFGSMVSLGHSRWEAF